MTKEEAIKRIKDWNLDNDKMEVLSVAIPELVESEDERIRNVIIKHFKEIANRNEQSWINLDIPNILAWLEKRGEQKSEKVDNLHNYLYGEQKLTDEVEPEFEIEKGKWYVCDTSRYTDFIVGKAYFCPRNGMLKPNENEMARYVAKHYFHLWTIQDAKNGDVLNSVRVKATIIFKGWNPDGKHINAYCALQKGIFIKQEMLWDRDFEPCPKNWNDELFSKMKESGYEWDAEKKELKKIEQKSTWSEEDERMFNSALWHIKNSCGNGGKNSGEFEVYHWLESIKERVQQSKQEVAKIVKKVFELLIEKDKVKLLLPKISNDAPKIYEGFMSNLSDLYEFANDEFKDKIVNVVVDNIALDNLTEVKETGIENAEDEYVDLGLPSGTLWKSANENGFYSYDVAVEKFGNQLPSKEQWEELKDKCKWKWYGDGYAAVIGPNGNHIFLPADGYRYGTEVNYPTSGFYWSSIYDDDDVAWYMYFNGDHINVSHYLRIYGMSVRLVK